jgi:hypothetical protein
MGVVILILVFGLIAVISIGSLVCWIMVLVKMFQNEQVGLGVASIFVPLIAFVFGWIKAAEWRIKGLMAVWTGCFAASLLMMCVVPVAISMIGERANSTFMTVGSSIYMPPTRNRP